MKNLFFIFIFVIFFCMCKSPSDEGTESNVPDQVKPEVLILPVTQITTGNQWKFHTRWSNDGSKIAFALYDQEKSETGIWIWEKVNNSIYSLVEGMSGDFSITWSPDDTKIAFDARENDNALSQIYIVTLSDGTILNFSNLDNNVFRPDWSHDGRFIIFTYSNSIYKKNVLSGELNRINNTDHGWNPSWNQDDSKIIFNTPVNGEDVFCVDSDGTNLTALAQSFSSTDTEVWPRWSFDNNQIVYEWFDGNISDIAIKNLETGTVNLITQLNDCRFPDWSPDMNSIVFTHNSNLWLVSLN